VHFENCPEALLVRFALARLGAVCVATNAMAAGPEIAHYAEASRATAAITQSSFAELVSAHAHNVRWVVASERESTDAGCGADSLAALFAEPAPGYPALPSDTAAIMFTTGTTGKPKGVVWTHSNVLWGCRYSAQVYGHRAEDVSLISLPLFHVVGLCWSFLPVLWAGGTAVLQPRFSASRFWPVSIAHRATLASHVLFTSMALQSQMVPERHYYRQWTVARGDRQSQSFNRIPAFVPSWGMTELVAPGICGDPNFRPAEGALGKPSLAHQIRVQDPEGKPVRAGETGELKIKGLRGLSIFQEYDGDPSATAAAFDDDGFFRTGDRVTLLDEGWIKFSDRASDVIKVGGEGVSPSEIEAVIRGVIGVRDVAVVGAQNSIYGQVPVAFVEAEAVPGRDLEGDILASCRASLAKFKVPQRVVVLSELPRIGNAKIAKAKLRQML
jgi:crotonobetaine/carnitine-CoA ligase